MGWNELGRLHAVKGPAGAVLYSLEHQALGGFKVVRFCAFAGWPANKFGLVSRYDLMPSTGKGFQSPIATVYTGGLVQHGLSAAGGVDGFYEYCSAADKR